MPSLCDVAHDGVLCAFSDRSLISPQPGKGVWSVRAGGMDRPSWTNRNLLSLLRQTALMGQLSSLRPH
jgi:hypothetical protein